MQWKHKAKALPEHGSHEGRGSTRQRHCLSHEKAVSEPRRPWEHRAKALSWPRKGSDEGSGNTGQRHCLSHQRSGKYGAKSVSYIVPNSNDVRHNLRAATGVRSTRPRASHLKRPCETSVCSLCFKRGVRSQQREACVCFAASVLHRLHLRTRDSLGTVPNLLPGALLLQWSHPLRYGRVHTNPRLEGFGLLDACGHGRSGFGVWGGTLSLPPRPNHKKKKRRRPKKYKCLPTTPVRMARPRR